MRNISARTAFIAVAAIGGAMIWGAAEIIALQWSRFVERLRSPGKYRAF